MDMKQIKLLAVVLLAAAASSVNAQTDNSTSSLESKLDSLQKNVSELQDKEADRSEKEYSAAVWKRKKYFNIGYTTQKMQNSDNPEKLDVKSQFGVNIDWGRTYYLHKGAIGGVMKIGLDWSWLNLAFAKYKSGNGIHITLPSMGGTDQDPSTDYNSESSEVEYSQYTDTDYEADVDLGIYSVHAGMSIGPSVTVAPFYNIGKGFQHILARTYFHVTPSYSAIIVSQNGSTDVYHGYTTFCNWGINIAYKAISIGYEYRWGKSKFNTITFDEGDDNEGEGSAPSLKNSDKQSIKFGASTVYVRFNF